MILNWGWGTAGTRWQKLHKREVPFLCLSKEDLRKKGGHKITQKRILMLYNA